MTTLREMKAQSHGKHRLATFSWLTILLVSCYVGGSSTGIGESTRQPTITQPPFTFRPSTTQLLVSTLSSSLTPSISPTSRPSATPTLPGYFLPHPALTWVAPPGYLDIRWLDDTHAAFMKLHAQPQCCCNKASEEWDIYDIPYDLNAIIDSPTPPTRATECNTPTQLPDIVDLYNIAGTIMYWQSASNGQRAFVMVATERPTAKLKLGNQDAPPEGGWYYEGWLIDLNRQNAQALFYSSGFFTSEWTDNNQYMVVVLGGCYGGNGGDVGLFSVDTHTSIIYNLDDSYNGVCEGGIGFSVAPGAHHLIYQSDRGTVVTLVGTQRAHICYQSESPRSYAWSPDGRYVFVACSITNDQPDILRRYDTQTASISTLTDRNQIRFKAINLAVSPDQTRILFEWGTNAFFNQEPYGIWLLDLQRLDK